MSAAAAGRYRASAAQRMEHAADHAQGGSSCDTPRPKRPRPGGADGEAAARQDHAGPIDGVHVYRVTPETIPARDAKRLLIHVHGGCYVLNPGEAALPEAVLMAGFSHIPVISVDYRMPPTAYFPAALDDAMTVYKAALNMEKPQDIGVFWRFRRWCAHFGDDAARQAGASADAGRHRREHPDGGCRGLGRFLPHQCHGRQCSGVAERLL